MTKIRRRQRCPECGSLDVIKWGSRGGHQRYKCCSCGAHFTSHREDIKMSNHFVWFRRWVQGKQTITDIAKDSGYSERQLRRWFDDYLDTSPAWKVPRQGPVHMMVDGTWFGNKERCLIVYRNYDTRSTVYYRLAEGENRNEIEKDLATFKELGLNIVSFTTDGGDDIVRAIDCIYPKVVRQRCVVHIERECLTWLTQHPRTSAGVTLRRLVRKISDIQTNNDRLFWTKELNRWHNEYEEFLKEKSVNKDTGEETYLHDSVRRTYVHLRRAIPFMFEYIKHPDVPSNTNSIESFFGHMKDNLRIHRGMSQEHQENFIKWYLYFMSDRKNNR